MLTHLCNAAYKGAGVDWITATSHDEAVCRRLQAIYVSIADAARASGFIQKKSGFQGYSGFAIESTFFGTREDGACLRVSGAEAQRAAMSVADAGANVSRVDYQITLELPEDKPQLARELVDDFRAERGRKTGAAELHTQLIDSAGSGSSATFGARSASWYGRIYDKHRESHGGYPPRYWRVESECKREQATASFYRLAEYGLDETAVGAFVRGQWERRGILIPMRTRVEIPEPIVTRVTSDVERKLAWLERVARPVVKELHDLGYAAEVSDKLYGWLAPDADLTTLF